MAFPLHDFHCMLKNEFMHYKSTNADSNQKFCLHRKKNLLHVIEPSLKDIETWWTTTIFWLSEFFSIWYLKRAMNIVQSHFPINAFQVAVKIEITYFLEY